MNGTRKSLLTLFAALLLVFGLAACKSSSSSTDNTAMANAQAPLPTTVPPINSESNNPGTEQARAGARENVNQVTPDNTYGGTGIASSRATGLKTTTTTTYTTPVTTASTATVVEPNTSTTIVTTTPAVETPITTTTTETTTTPMTSSTQETTTTTTETPAATTTHHRMHKE